MTPKALILRAPGINRDEDAAAAVELAGGQAERVHINRVVEGSVRLHDYALLIIPGGFSYGDHLGAGKLLAIDLTQRLIDQLHPFVADGRPVLGICNGFQVLVKAGILPGIIENREPRTENRESRTEDRESGLASIENPTSTIQNAVTLTDNKSGRFECRWVRLAPEVNSRCIFTQGLGVIETPVAHGEGRFITRDAESLQTLESQGLVALRYVDANDQLATYPANPNGSDGAIAGICNPAGNVLGLMPHPEDAILLTQHPRWTREPYRVEGDGLALFRNVVRYASTL
jgi:phosphoribosylformylglycinamidine synthase